MVRLFSVPHDLFLKMKFVFDFVALAAFIFCVCPAFGGIELKPKVPTKKLF